MSISNRDIIILAGDFNAKTGLSHENYPSVVGRYGKGKTNSNGEFLIEFALKNELFLTNTTFKHKMLHRMTWECPQRVMDHRDQNSGTTRKNPYRNQIDNIIVRKKSSITIPNTTTITSTCNVYKIQFADDSTAKQLPHYLKPNNSKNDNHNLNMQRLQDPVCRQQYSETVAALLEEGQTSESKKKETAQDAVEQHQTSMYKSRRNHYW